MNRVRDALSTWQKPVLVVWGNEDTVLLPRIAEHFVTAAILGFAG